MSTATLYIEKKKTLVPQLRFQKFDDKWTKITNTIQIIAGNAYSLNDYQDEGIILIQGLNITPGKLDTSTINYISDTHKAKHIILSEGDILLGLNRPVTNGELKVCRYSLKTRGYLYQRAGKLQFNKDQIYSDFLYQYLRSDNFLKDITNELVGSDQPYIRSNLFQVAKLNFPTFHEQQKIASFLSAVDEKIQQLSRKKELLEQYKKGVMQQLFSGKLRFKDENGEDYPDWEEKKLGEVCTNISYGMNAAATTYDGQNKYLRITDIDESSNGLNLDKLTSPKGKLEDKFRVKVGDLLFARTGASVGKTYLYRNSDGILYFAGFLIRFSVKGAIPAFVYLQTQTSKYNKWVKVMSMRSGQPGINAEEYKTFEISFPCLEEQQKIADFLSSIDVKIESTSQQINQTQSFKKGLLQRMFV